VRSPVPLLHFPPARSRKVKSAPPLKRRQCSKKPLPNLKANEATALAKFNKGEGGFKDRDLYVFCFDMNARKTTAHVNQSVIGSAPGDIKEKDGSPLGEKVFAAMKEETITTVSYNFPKPGTTEPVPKESYVTRVGNQGCGVGYYK
jgi:signal transduction histidine kinase